MTGLGLTLTDNDVTAGLTLTDNDVTGDVTGDADDTY